MSIFLQLYTQLYLGGGIPKVIEQLSIDFKVTQGYVGLFDTTQPSYLNISNLVQIGGPMKSKLKLVNWYRRYRSLQNFKKEKTVTVTLSHTIWLHLLNILAGGDDKKVLLLHASINTSNAFSWWERFLLKAALFLFAKYTYACVAVSVELENELKRIPGIKKKVIHILNYFEIEDIIQKSNEPLHPQLDSILTDYPVFVSAGRLSPQKNYAFLIELFAKLKKTDTYSSAKLVIMGKGPQLDMLINLALFHHLNIVYSNTMEEYDLQKADIVFLGYMANPYPVLKKSALYISTSLYEGFPIAVCEALVLEKLVVISDCPTGHIEIISGGIKNNYSIGKNPYGILLPLRNLSKQQALNQWYDFMIENADLVLNNQGKGERMHRFCKDHKNKQLMKWQQVMETSF